MHHLATGAVVIIFAVSFLGRFLLLGLLFLKKNFFADVPKVTLTG